MGGRDKVEDRAREIIKKNRKKRRRERKKREPERRKRPMMDGKK